MNLGELKKSVTSGKIEPIYYITGSDEFIKNMAVERLKTVVNDFKEMNVTVLSNPDPATALDIMTTFPFCADYRVVVIEDVSDFSPYLEYFKNPCETTVLALRESDNQSKGKKKESPEKASADRLIASFPRVECEPLEGNQMLSFLAREAEAYDAGILETAAKLLIEYCRSDMFRLLGEIRKLASLRSGDIISEEDVKELVSPDVEYSVWSLADEIARGSEGKALFLFSRLDDGKADTRTKLFGAVYSHFRKLYYAAVTPSDGLLMETLNIKQFMIGKTRGQAKKIGAKPLGKMIEFLADFDYRSKNGMIPENAYGEALMLGLIGTMKGETD